MSSEDKKKILALPSVQANSEAPHQSTPTWGKQAKDMTLFMMARDETKLLFPKSGLKGIQGKNLFFNNAGNDGRPVVFSFPDIVDPSQQLWANHRKGWMPSNEDWRCKSDKTVSPMCVMLFNIQMMWLPGTPWFASEETIAELKRGVLFIKVYF